VKNKLLPPLVAEFLGAMLLVMSTIGSMIMSTVVLDSPKNVALLGNAVAVGFILSTLIEMFAPISGSHFNAVVTMIMWLVSNLQAILFVVVQILGGVVGTVVTHLMFFEEIGGILFVSDNVRSGSRYFSEVVATFILMLVILMLTKVKSNKTSLMIGLLVSGLIMATSSTIFANPQVTIARILTNTESGIRLVDGVMFIFMQIIGALSAYGIYKLVFDQKQSIEAVETKS
jgi:glycerol uptake facilitator-like aquaporin